MICITGDGKDGKDGKDYQEGKDWESKIPSKSRILHLGLVAWALEVCSLAQ